MAIDDKKGAGLSAGLKQFGAVVLAFVLCFVAIYWNALTIGYVIVTLALGAFLLAVAFDVGVSKAPVVLDSDEDDKAPVLKEQTPAGRRGNRSARTA